MNFYTQKRGLNQAGRKKMLDFSGITNKQLYTRTFFIALSVSFIMFLPFLVFDYGRFFFYGDFNVQQIPFYMLAHDSVQDGNIFWNWNTDLGVNFIGSYSFYLLGSPFFWLTLLFPSKAVSYLIAPLLMLKISLCATFACAFVKRFVKNPAYAALGGFLYAFSGFSVYNIFFNHFHEAMVIFPLLLISLDELIENDRRGFFAVCVFLSAIMNYFFFVGQVVFIAVYFFIRLFSNSWDIKPRHFLRIAFESVIGLLLSGVILLPAVITVLTNSRTSEFINGWNAIVYASNQRYVHILQSMFFPPDIPARPNFTPDSNSKWSSLGVWLPMFGMTGVIAFLQLKEKHWLKTAIWTFLVVAFVPFLNAAFYLFNQGYYARWYYMLSLLFSLATALSLENIKVEWNRALRWSVLFTLGIALPIALFKKNPDDEENSTLGLMAYPDRFWSYVAIALISIFLVYIFVWLRKQGKVKPAMKCALGGTIAISLVFSIYFITLGKTHSYDTHNYIVPYAIKGKEEITLPDKDAQNFRIDVYEGMDNLGMYWRLPSINTFHSIVPASVTEFYETMGVERAVASRPEIQKYGLRELLSVKWLFVPEDKYETFNQENEIGHIYIERGYEYFGFQNGFYIYENKNYVPYGFTFDSFISRDDFEIESTTYRHLLLLKAMVLDEQQISEFGNELMNRITLEDVNYEKNSYLSDCDELLDEYCYNFEVGNRGFSADIDLEKENMVFFSVPYEEGWSARVNGKEAQIEKVSYGFMAVRCPKGTSHIEFFYMTPGLKTGIIISLSAFLVLTAYLIAAHYLTKKKER